LIYCARPMCELGHLRPRRIAVIFVVLNNKSYRILKQRLHALQGNAAQLDRYVGLELDDPTIDFVGLAHTFGIRLSKQIPLRKLSISSKRD